MIYHFISQKENRDYYLNGTSRLEILGNGFSNVYSPIRRDALMIQECCKGKSFKIFWIIGSKKFCLKFPWNFLCKKNSPIFVNLEKEKFKNCADQIKQLNSTLFDPMVTKPIEIDFAKAFYFKDEYISFLIKTTHLPTGFKVSTKKYFLEAITLSMWVCVMNFTPLIIRWPSGFLFAEYVILDNP